MRTWVLGGGAARGAAQVGVLLALLEAGIPRPQRIIGVSVGALNGVVLARHPTVGGAHVLRETWRSRAAADVFRPHPLESLRTRLGGRSTLSMLPATSLVRLVRRQLSLLNVTRFEDLLVPLQIGVTHLGDGRAHFLQEGDLGPALAASAAIPGVFPGMEVGGERYFDGGVADNDPIVEAVQQGADEVIAITLCATEGANPRPRRWLELLGQSVAVMLHARMLADFALVRDRARVSVFAPMLPPGSAWNLQAANVTRLMERTRQATAGWLDQHDGLPATSTLIPLPLGAGPDFPDP